MRLQSRAVQFTEWWPHGDPTLWLPPAAFRGEGAPACVGPQSNTFTARTKGLKVSHISGSLLFVSSTPHSLPSSRPWAESRAICRKSASASLGKRDKSPAEFEYANVCVSPCGFSQKQGHLHSTIVNNKRTSRKQARVCVCTLGSVCVSE